MAKTIANVLTGVAVLSVRDEHALAKWVIAQQEAGSYSAKLTKDGSGNAGSTHAQFEPTTVAVTLQDLQDDITGVQNGFSYYHRESVVTVLNWTQFELRFEDPASDGWLEITCVPHQGIAGVVDWAQYIVVAATPAGYGGQTPDGSSVFDWSLANDLTNIAADILALFNAAEAGSGAATAAYILTRVRLELWEVDARSVWVDTVAIDGQAYAIEPGSVTPGLVLSSPNIEVGYTEDGVTMEYTADEADIEVEEETFPIDRVITKETVAITCNMAESSLFNMDKAIAGSALSGNVITLGGGVNKLLNLTLEGLTPAGFKRSIYLPKATATGAVGMPYKKGEKTVVPVTFQALKGDEYAVLVVDCAA